MQLSKDELSVLSKLLDQGLDLPEDARGAWVEGLSEPFPGAKALLAKMLAEEASGGGDAFLDTLPKLATDTDTHGAQPSGLQSGSRIGIYVLVRELGQGGMATVWLARRTDELIQRPVALKLPHLHMQSARFAERFARERDILANLTHPHIAHLYDAGISPEGQPFLAMEFVAGEPLTDYCAKQSLGLDERLQLFLQVLAAVDYAHTQGVIHRDLKPSNILVREGGQVVLLDFGIAKLIVEGQVDQTELTILGGAALTPHYASPEQIKGEALGPATDVYSLGVLLYELLSGRRPYELTGSTRGALEQAILSTEPRRPSEVVTQRTRTGDTRSSTETPRSRLRGDLDTIVLKALKKNPTERYPSAGAFAEDLRRYLRGDVVGARPDSLWYQAKKWAHRNKPLLQGVAITLAVTAVLVLGASALSRRTGQSIVSTLTTVPTLSMSATGNRTPSAQPALGDYSIAVLPFADMSEKKDQEYFADGMAEEILDILVKIPTLQVIGRTSSFQFKGKNEDLRTIGTLLGVAYVVEGSVRKSGDHVRITAQLIDARYGTHRWSDTYDRNVGDVLTLQDEIAAGLVRALELTVAPVDPSRPPVLNGTAYDELLKGRFALDQWGPVGIKEAAMHFQRVLDRDPSSAVATAYLALAYAAQGEWAVAPPGVAFELARRAAESAARMDSSLALPHTVLSSVHGVYDWDWPAADREIQEALRLAPREPLALIFAAKQMMAEGHLDHALQYAKSSLAQDPLSPPTMIGICWIQQRLGHWVDAEAAARRALEISPSYSIAHYYLGVVLLARGQDEAALAEFQKETDDEGGLAMAYFALGRESDSNAALAQMLKDQANDNAFGIAEVYAFRGQLDESLRWLDRAYAQKDAGLYLIKGDPVLKNLESDRRYQSFLRKMHLPG